MKKQRRKIEAKRPNAHGNAIQAKNVMVFVTQSDIAAAECGKPTKCMIKVALKRALNLAHGYIHVDASGISISRNGKYREKAFIPRPALINMLKFDKDKHSVKPFRFKLQFVKTTPIQVKSEEAAERQYAKNVGKPRKKYDMRSRVVGIAAAGGAQIAA